MEASLNSGDQRFVNCFTSIIGSNKIALLAAQKKARDLGYHTSIIKENADEHTEALARTTIKNCAVYNGKRPACLLIGGETTLAVKGTGKGGRNQHFVLCALDELCKNGSNQTQSGVIVLSAGTDAFRARRSTSGRAAGGADAGQA